MQNRSSVVNVEKTADGIYRASGVEKPSRGVCSTNRPPANLKNEISEQGGEDRAVLSLYVRWGEPAWQTLGKTLDEAKKIAQDKPEDLSRFVKMGNYLGEVKHTGKKAGGASGPMFIWQMIIEGRRFSIARLQEPKGEVPNVIVDVSSLELMR